MRSVQLFNEENKTQDNQKQEKERKKKKKREKTLRGRFMTMAFVTNNTSRI